MMRIITRMTSTTPAGKAIPGTTPQRVLVVDDNIDTVHSMALLLKMMGHDVQFAINGLAAIDVARSFRPDVILLDLGLPDIGGDQLARQLRFEPGLERMRIIAITGRSDDAVRRRAEAAGCEAVLAKPIEPAKLEQLLSGAARPRGAQARP
jgi:hypothetical protein